MRIIGGTARGRTISAPKGNGTRPTTDRVREALFSALQSRLDLENIGVLDLFAGSGALSFEAISRGAQRATLVELNRSCSKLIESNAERLRFTSQCRVINLSAERYLNRLEASQQTFELIFVDAPYRIEPWPMVEAVSAAKLLAPDGIVVVEHAKALCAPERLGDLEASFNRHYGDTAITFFD